MSLTTRRPHNRVCQKISQMKKKIDFGNLIVFLIDMQSGFIKNDAQKIDIVSNQMLVLEFCITKLIPVVVFEYLDQGRTIRNITRLLKNKNNGSIYFLEKIYDDAFLNPVTDKILKAYDIDTILLMGVNASYCVYETAKTALAKGYCVATSADLIAGYNSKRPECRGPSWYKKNTIFFDNHNMIIEAKK